MKSAANKPFKKIAVAFSLCLLILWAVLGTGASLAWFSDTTPELNNIFHFADFQLEVSHRLTDGSWEQVDSQTKIFDDEALYEPGYVQVVYLKVENEGDVPFRFYTAVNVNRVVHATNVEGESFNLQDYLLFGLTTTSSETEMKNSIPDRAAAEQLANLPLHNYESEGVVVEPQGDAYIALVVRMPQNVGNEANYRGDTVPRVELGVTVMATQITE